MSKGLGSCVEQIVVNRGRDDIVVLMSVVSSEYPGTPHERLELSTAEMRHDDDGSPRDSAYGMGLGLIIVDKLPDADCKHRLICRTTCIRHIFIYYAFFMCGSQGCTHIITTIQFEAARSSIAPRVTSCGQRHAVRSMHIY